MEAGKGASASVMEAAANVAASAKSGMEKTKAVVGEKVEKLTTSDPVEKDMATLKKEEKIFRAEQSKQEAYAQNAAASVGLTSSYTAKGTGDLIGANRLPTKAHHGMVSVGDGLTTEDVVKASYNTIDPVEVVDPPNSNIRTRRTTVGGPSLPVAGSDQIRNTGSTGHTTVGGMYP